MQHKTWGTLNNTLATPWFFLGVAYSTTAANVLAEKAGTSAGMGGPSGASPPVLINPSFARATEEGLTAPDRVFFLDIKPEETKDRKGYGAQIGSTYIGCRVGVYIHSMEVPADPCFLRCSVNIILFLEYIHPLQLDEHHL